MSEKACGTIGRPCPDVGIFPICNPADPNDAWTGLKRLTVYQKKAGSTDPKDTFIGLLPPEAPLSEGHRNPTLGDVNAMLQSGYLSGNGYAGICRSPSLTGEVPDRWFAYQGHPGKAGKIAFFNDYKPSENGAMFRTPIELSGGEVLGLIVALGLRELDIACEPGACAKDGSADAGKYYFTSDGIRLAYIIAQLANPALAIPGLTPQRRDAIIGQLTPFQQKADRQSQLVAGQIEFLKKQMENSDDIKTGQWIQILFSALLLAAIGYPVGKDIWQKIRGRVKTTNFGEYVAALLRQDFAYEVKGRMEEARKIWRMTDTTGYRHIIIDSPTGEGKDKVVEAMMILKVKGDASVLPMFQSAPVLKINAAEFQANTQYRGNVADKVAEIAGLARKGPVIVYISEIDLIFLSGGSLHGDTEAVGKLLLDLVEDPAIKRNLIIVGTTSRGSEMLAKYPDLQRRFNWPGIHSFSLKEVADILSGPTTKGMETAYGVKFNPAIAEAAAKLAEALFRPSTRRIAQSGAGAVLPRIDAVKTILEDAAKLARDAKGKQVTVDHVIKAVEGRSGERFDPALIEALLKMDIDQVTTESATALLKQRRAPDAVTDLLLPACETIEEPLVIGGTTDAEAIAALAQMEQNPLLAGQLKGLSPAEKTAVAKDLILYWKALPQAFRRAQSNPSGANEQIVLKEAIEPIPANFLRRFMQAKKSGTLAEGVDKAKAEEKEEKSEKSEEKRGMETQDAPGKGGGK